MIDHVVIMAASLNRDMEDLTSLRPKALLPLLGRPIIARVMDSFYEAGIRRFTLVVGEAEGGVALWLNENWHADSQVIYVPQGMRRGTAAALFAAKNLLARPFIIASIDVILPASFIEGLRSYFDDHSRYSGALTLFQTPDEIYETTGVLLDPMGHVIYVSEQPIAMHQLNNISLPVYAFKPEITGYLDKAPIEDTTGARGLASVIQSMIDGDKLVGALQVSERIRLKTAEDLRTANLTLLNEADGTTTHSDVPSSVKINPPVYVDSDVIIGEGVHLGPNVYLEKGSRVGTGARLRNAIVLGGHVGAKQYIEEAIIHEELE